MIYEKSYMLISRICLFFLPIVPFFLSLSFTYSRATLFPTSSPLSCGHLLLYFFFHQVFILLNFFYILGKYIVTECVFFSSDIRIAENHLNIQLYQSLVGTAIFTGVKKGTDKGYAIAAVNIHSIYMYFPPLLYSYTVDTEIKTLWPGFYMDQGFRTRYATIRDLLSHQTGAYDSIWGMAVGEYQDREDYLR